jgi:hypothetical protein
MDTGDDYLCGPLSAKEREDHAEDEYDDWSLRSNFVVDMSSALVKTNWWRIRHCQRNIMCSNRSVIRMQKEACVIPQQFYLL